MSTTGPSDTQTPDGVGKEKLRCSERNDPFAEFLVGMGWEEETLDNVESILMHCPSPQTFLHLIFGSVIFLREPSST